MTISKNLQEILYQIPSGVKLVAVSKTKTEAELMEAYLTGHRLFGENKVQELLLKHDHLPKDIEWHFIGHLQTNKVKFIAPFIALIHSVDSYKLLQTINTEAIRFNRIIPVLLQFHIASEESKFGFSIEEALEMLSFLKFTPLTNVKIVGVMGMATFTDDEVLIRAEFQKLHTIFQTLRNSFFISDPNFKEISMGMSDDYQLAIREGSTMVRIGSHIFGSRQYNPL